MTQERLNSFNIDHVHKDTTDSLCLIGIANEFVSSNSYMSQNLTIFKEFDLN